MGGMAAPGRDPEPSLPWISRLFAVRLRFPGMRLPASALPRMLRRVARCLPSLAATLVLTAALAACSDTDADPGRETTEPSPTTSAAEALEPSYLPAGDLPAPCP